MSKNICFALLIVLFLSACSPPPPDDFVLPTMAVLPTPVPTMVPAVQMAATGDALFALTPTQVAALVVATATPSATITETSTPTQVSTAAPTVRPGREIAGCDLTAWISDVELLAQELNAISQAGLTIENLGNYYDRVYSLDYPSCMAQARTYMLATVGSFQRMVAAANSGSTSAAEFYSQEAQDHLNAFGSEVDRVLNTLVADPVSVQPPSGGVSCGGATTCGQMSSCEQAYACLREGRSSLDRDKDGIPCESLCGG